MDTVKVKIFHTRDKEKNDSIPYRIIAYKYDSTGKQLDKLDCFVNMYRNPENLEDLSRWQKNSIFGALTLFTAGLLIEEFSNGCNFEAGPVYGYYWDGHTIRKECSL